MSTLSSWIPGSSSATKPKESHALDTLPTPPELSPSTRLLVALAARSATTKGNALLPSLPARTQQWYLQVGKVWSESVCNILKFEKEKLPSEVDPASVLASATELWTQFQSDEIKEKEIRNVVENLVIASIFTPPSSGEEVKTVDVPGSAIASSNHPTSPKKDTAKDVPTLSYTPSARHFIHTTLSLLTIPSSSHLPQVEKSLSLSLFKTLQNVSHSSSVDVESTREKSSAGWGGKTGRNIVTGLGVIAGGIALGVTGGLAAPAIAALIPGFMSFGLLSAASAPIVLGSVFGLAGGGLTGRRVRERWSGVDQFAFVDVKLGSTPITEAPVEPSPRVSPSSSRRASEVPPEGEDIHKPVLDAEGNPIGLHSTPQPTINLKDLESKDLKEPKESSESKDSKETPTIPKDNNKMKKPVEEEPLFIDKYGEAVVDYSEKVLDDIQSTFRKISLTTGLAQPTKEELELKNAKIKELEKEDEKRLLEGKPPSLVATIAVPGLLTVSETEALAAWQKNVVPHCFSDGRDVFVLNYETKLMLSTGKAVNAWVIGKVKQYVKKEIIKRTFMSAYFAAVSLPLTVYSLATLGLDNTWMRSQEKAIKAGKLLGEVLEKRVQGQRPVVLIGSSLGSLTILHALLYLASLPNPANLPQIVDSVYLISLPAAPTTEEWASVRSVVGSRIVNAWCGSDFVLASVVRLHEVVSRAATLSNGVQVAGLGPVNKSGVEDIDISEVVDGHIELQAKMPQIIDALKIDS